MTKNELIAQIRLKKSFLCIGLDPDLDRIPKHLLQFDDPIFEFNKSIIQATSEFCVAYKPNIAFYEQLGAKGWITLEKTINLIPKECLIIADAKRGDIGNTSKYYAKAFFETLKCDAITVAPYMGEDSVKPFLNFNNKWVILLALTSNVGAYDFQFFGEKENPLFIEVLKKAKKWGSPDQLMFVVGATKTKELEIIRKSIPDYFLLVPGIGAQGGSLDEVVEFGANKECGLLINSSRNILYANDGKDFANYSKLEALKLQQKMKQYIERYNW